MKVVFWVYSNAGHKLGELHLGYETVKPYKLVEEAKRLVMEPGDFRVQKMVFGKKEGGKDKTVVHYNENLALRGIPLEAYE